MKDFNRSMLIGRLTRDPELKATSSGMYIARFSVACNSTEKKGDEWGNRPDFFDCIAFGKLSEIVSKYAFKGTQIHVDGRLKQERWESQDGKSMSKVVIICENIQLLSKPKGPDSQEQPEHNFGPVDDEEIPY